MILIQKGESNELIVTLQEKTTLVDPVYLFSFTHKISETQKTFILSDTSEYPVRYNQFTFTEGSSLAKTLEEGVHYYEIYAQESLTNLDPALADEEVERGIARVDGTPDEGTEYEFEDTNIMHEIDA